MSRETLTCPGCGGDPMECLCNDQRALGSLAPAYCSEVTPPNQHIYTEADAEIAVMKWLAESGNRNNGKRTVTWSRAERQNAASVPPKVGPETC